MVNHHKILKYECPSEQVLAHVQRSGLLPLHRCCHFQVDSSLISAFVERWHPETCSFHLPFGEMSISLDDMSCLTHLPLGGDYYVPGIMTKEIAQTTMMGLIGATEQEAKEEIRATRGSYCRLATLRRICSREAAAGRHDTAARAFLLHLIGATLFANKSSTSVPVSWLSVFRDLTRIDRWAWGAMGLAFLYHQLEKASVAKISTDRPHLAGFVTILQVCLSTTILLQA